MLEPYKVACCQIIKKTAKDVSSIPKIRKENVDHALEMIDKATSKGRDKGVRVCVFPEFFLTNEYFMVMNQGHEPGGIKGSKIERQMSEICIQIPGKETDRLAEKAIERNIYIAAASFEYIPDWPERHWNCGYIISPEGKVILKYHKECDPTHCITLNVSAGDVYEEYIKRYGENAVFPVVKTPIGVFAVTVCCDNNFPEIWRCMAMKGAEVIFHPTGEGYAPHHSPPNDPWEYAKRTRAYENTAYVVDCNGGLSRGRSEIINFDGGVIAVADGPGEVILHGRVDIDALRYRRTRPGWNPIYEKTFLIGLRAKLYAKEYEKFPGWPLNYFADKPIKSIAQLKELEKEIVENLVKKGIFIEPSK